MSKREKTLMIRYISADHARRHVIQRGDGKYWTGEGFSKILDEAKIFKEHKVAQTACAALQYQQYKGKPVRTFKVEVHITLAADDVEEITQDKLLDYLLRSLRMDMENSVHGDGPVEGSFVQARMRLSSLEETEPTRKKF